MKSVFAFTLVLAALGCGGGDPPSRDAAVADDARISDGAPGDSDSGRVSRYGAPVRVGVLPAIGLPEISGIVASRTQPGVFWVENDSSNPANIFAIDVSGALLATIQLVGATNTDWEDISIDQRAGVDELYVIDAGDNVARTSDGASGRAGVRIYRLAEPLASAGDAAIGAEQFDFAYPVRPYDCEAVFVDHLTGDVYFLTKEASPAEIFVARAPLDAGTTTVLTHVGTIDFDSVTAADMSTDATRIVVRGYATVRVFPVTAGAEPVTAFASPFARALPASPAEAIAFEHDGYGVYTVAEGDSAELFYLPWE